MSRFNPALYEKTPMVSVLDNRGLHVRDIGYHRAEVNNATDTRITRHQYNIQGSLIQSLDPRLYASQQNDSTIKPNFIWQYDLNGQILHTDSVDAGRTVTLNDIEGRPIMAVTATEVTQKWQYEAPSLSGRLLSVSEQAVNVSPRITERLLWSDNSQQAKDNNLVGQCIKHYDPAGLNQLQSGSLTGAILKQSRQFILDDQQANWTDANLGLLDNTIYTTQSHVDATGMLLTQTDAKGNSQRLAYDIAGQLKGSWLTLKDQNEQIILKSLTYSAAGQKLQEVHGNGVITDYTYEPETQRLISITTHRPSDAKVLQDLRYDYDPVGNVLNIRNDTEATRFWRNQKVVPENSYSYDSLYQLINATGREMANIGQQSNKLPPPISPIDSSTYTNYTHSYSYDNAGNLLQIRHSSPATNNNYTLNITISNRSNHAVSQDLAEKPEQVDAQFDAGGHQMNLIPGQSLKWNSRGELHQVNKTGSSDSLEEYRYDSTGMRMLKVSEQQRVTYLAGLELRTTKNGGNITEDLQMISVGEAGRAQVRVLHWESGKPTDIDNNQLRYSYDNLLGSSQLELDGTGQIITEEEYYPYGGTSVWATRNQTETHYKTIRYSGKERDATGLYYYGFRYYQPWVGRWLSADPAGTIDGLNLYRMVRNNPISLQDSDGRAPDEDLLSKEGKQLAKGHISTLAKRGLLTGKSSSPIGLTFDAVRVDSKIRMTEARPYDSNDKDFRDKIITSSGTEVTSLESGTGQVGDYWDKHHLGSDVSLINVVNGEAGTIGIRIPLNAIEEKKPIVLTSGGLSGCTMLCAHDQQYFYAYHTGQSNPSEWRTGVGGIETTAESHRLLTGKDPGEPKPHNNSLIALFENYESAHITYFGKEGTKITENSEKVLTSDYNSFKSFDPAIGYAYALLARVGNEVKIKTLSEETHIPKPGKLNFKSSVKTKNSVIIS
ncbi:cytotoxic necrotizing factor Rho-activating domain-containing protein [Xenorhabdus bovienii]|uniref:cytotoxic necrotizing factor Rho-activating domain-containing protein n=1 Tax=Xenorhabdus bovienii TaxID=40576 RepID=UPI003DA66330